MKTKLAVKPHIEGEDAFVVMGGETLKGEVLLSGAKNVSLKLPIAALLMDCPVVLKNVPNLKDIRELILLLESLGVKTEHTPSSLTINPTGLQKNTVDLLYGSKIRVSFMLFAPFIKKFGKAYIPNPGGCRIGERPINRQIELLKAFGIETEYHTETGYYEAILKEKYIWPTTFTFQKKSHTGTELAVMIASFAEGRSVIKNAALEPEIDDLIAFMNTSGAGIKRSGDDIIIKGKTKLKAPQNAFNISSDRNEAVTYAVFALATKGDVYLKGAKKEHMSVFMNSIENIGGGIEAQKGGIRFYHKGSLRSSDITTSPEPGFMTDWQAPWAVLMTQAHGTSTIHETVFENRFGYVSELKRLGARIKFYDPKVTEPERVYQFDRTANKENCSLKQAIRIHGPSALHGGVMDVTDMRAGATLLIGACAAKGESVINGASEIDRGYDNVEYKLQSLGAHIKRI